MTQINTLKLPFFPAQISHGEKESLAAFKLALDVVKAKGITSKSRDGVDLLILQTEQVSIEFTPAKHERPNGLNVWRHGDFRSFRVLDVIWTDGAMPLILVYRGGAPDDVLSELGVSTHARNRSAPTPIIPRALLDICLHFP